MLKGVSKHAIITNADIGELVLRKQGLNADGAQQDKPFHMEKYKIQLPERPAIFKKAIHDIGQSCNDCNGETTVSVRKIQVGFLRIVQRITALL